MQSHAEIELKWALSAQAHAALQEHLVGTFGTARRLAQTNRFFDTGSLALRSSGMNLRLRLEDQGGRTRLLLTCKRKLADQHGAHHHEEWEEWLDPGIWHQLELRDPGTLLPLPAHVRESVGGERLHALGGFTNDRLEWQHQQELICLDRTDYAVRIDHELEIETGDPASSSQEWSARLKAWGIPWSNQPVSKFARFLHLGAAREARQAGG